ncbi:MAG TPA: MraY family glycosyltransferase [Synergistaceae bacterium]|nr:MraY family glycosyltransferase [Synergistaceae bacterium]HPJ25101.1 MraY family glycosyltransferase [Synergistaceae bacterium]HPQ36580.1 MraY family glycosyltransferase [Synergistaceae bacterium]
MGFLKEISPLLLSLNSREFLVPLVILCGGFGASFLLTPLSIRLSYVYQIVDRPGGRKKHAAPTPKGGGLALWGAFVVYMLLQRDFSLFHVLFLSGATLIFLVGYADSIFPIPPLIRLGVHLFASFLVVYSADFPFFFGLIMILWLAGCTSAYNNIDGINGLCLSLGAVNFMMAFFFTMDPVWLYLLGMCLGVLMWNFPNAQTFLGDGGSTFVGFLWSSLVFHGFAMGRGFEEVPLLGMLWMLCLIGGLPVFDTLCSVFRRLLRKRSPFLPDRGHFHYALYDRGFSLWKVLGILVPIHGILVFLGLFWLCAEIA